MEKKDINIEYGKILRNYRKKNNLTLENVSEISGLAPRYISQIERGESIGSINTLLNLHRQTTHQEIFVKPSTF